MSIEITTRDAAATMAVGRRLAGLTRAGDVLAISGPLGAGKTAFVGGLAEGLGIDEPVTSPSFVLMRRYDSGFVPLVHVDVYRLSSMGEFEDLNAFDEADDGVLVIEWGSAVGPALPHDHLVVDIAIEDEQTRTVQLIPAGTWIGRPLTELTV